MGSFEDIRYWRVMNALIVIIALAVVNMALLIWIAVSS